MDEQSEPPTFSILAVGAIYQDVILTVPHFPHEDEKLAATTRVVRVGGNIPNTLAVLAQVLPRWASVVFASVVAGEEGVWRPMIEELEELGGQNENGGGNVRVLFEVRDGKKDMMPTAYILESQQTRSRSIISHNQIRELSTEAVLSLLWTYSLQPSHLAADYDELLATWYNNGGTYVPDWIHFEGRNTETVMGLIKHYRKNKNVVRLVVSVEFEKYGREGLSALVEECDVAFFAETWAREEVARSREGMMEDDRSEIAGREAMDVDAFFEVITPRLRGGAVAFLMVGELGAYVFHQSVDKMWVSTHIPAISILPDEIVETTGAGDTFIAAAIYALGITGLDAVRACKLAVRVSGMKCSVQGFGGLERAFSEAGQRSSIVDGRERSVGVDVESRRREGLL